MMIEVWVAKRQRSSGKVRFSASPNGPAAGWISAPSWLEGSGPNLYFDQVSEKRTRNRVRRRLALFTNTATGKWRGGSTRYPWRYIPDSDFAVDEGSGGTFSALFNLRWAGLQIYQSAPFRHVVKISRLPTSPPSFHLRIIHEP